MPGISDPGYELIIAALKRGTKVVPVPGPSAVITAVAVSGLAVDRFLYVGFLPLRSAGRRKVLESVAGERGSIVAFETPHRLRAALGDIKEVLGDRQIAVCRQLTKLHEEVFRGSVSRALDYFTEPRGEFVLVIEGEKETAKAEITGEIRKELAGLRNSGKRAKEVDKEMAKRSGISRRELYRAWLKLP